MIRSLAWTIPFAAALLLLAPACVSAEDRASVTRGGATAPGAADAVAVEMTVRRLEHAGVSIELPKGWRGRVLAPGVIQAANFDFAPGGRELPPGEQDPIKAMTMEHALVIVLPCGLVSFEETPRPAPASLSLQHLTFMPHGHPRIPVGHAFAYGSFDFSGRCVRVEADFGGTSPSTELKNSVDAILASLSIRT